MEKIKTYNSDSEILNNHKVNSKVLCVTTFNNKLYNEYAHNFLKTYNFNFDLIIYSEEQLDINNTFNKNITIVNSSLAIPEMINFINKNSERNIIDVENINYKGDAIRFCYKVFAVTHAGLLFKKYQYLIWLDADIIFLTPLSLETILKKYINNNYMMSFLGRKHMHSECGILFFNMKHPYIIEYFKEMLRMYTSNDIYNLEEWHDSYVWDHVRIKFEKDYNITNYSIGCYQHKTDIFDYTSLSLYMIHLKGKLKYIKNIKNIKDITNIKEIRTTIKINKLKKN
jgi:hypothetical protein